MDRVDYEPLIVQDLINWTKHGELNLSPWYQRRSVWSRPQKAYLLNTLFEQKPVPTLYFRHSVSLELDRSVREVVDGQQRIRAILEFLDGSFRVRHPNHKKRVSYDDLIPAEKKHLRETKLSGGWLLGATDADVIEIFGRLNSVAKTLNAAEKRNAKYSGEFKQFCLRQAAERLPFWRDLNVFTANGIARMEEVEFVSEVVRNLMQGLSDFSAGRLDAVYAEYDEEFDAADAIAARLDRVFSKLAAIPSHAIRDTIFRRPPLLFSLIIELDGREAKVATSELTDALLAIDARFQADEPASKKDEIFRRACLASTQRIASRRIRRDYIASFLG